MNLEFRKVFVPLYNVQWPETTLSRSGGMLQWQKKKQNMQGGPMYSWEVCVTSLLSK